MGKDVVGKGVTGFVIGDCIVSDDNHAEYVCVPIKNGSKNVRKYFE